MWSDSSASDTIVRPLFHQIYDVSLSLRRLLDCLVEAEHSEEIEKFGRGRIVREIKGYIKIIQQVARHIPLRHIILLPILLLGNCSTFTYYFACICCVLALSVFLHLPLAFKTPLLSRPRNYTVAF